MTVPVSDQEAAEKLASLLLTIKHNVTRDAGRLKRTEANRTNMLIVHAVAALVISPLFALSYKSMVGPIWTFLSFIPGFPFSFATLFWIGGAILLPATLLRHRRWEMVGLSFISLWYTMLSIGFAIPTVKYVFGHHTGPVPPSYYAWAVYLHLAVIMRVHLWTLWRMGRAARRERSDLT